MRNPQYEDNVEKQIVRATVIEQAKKELTTKELHAKVVTKIRQQWKSILKAFKDMNKDINVDGISPPELRFYMNHWGFQANEEQFMAIFS